MRFAAIAIAFVNLGQLAAADCTGLVPVTGDRCESLDQYFPEPDVNGNVPQLPKFEECADADCDS